MNGPTHDPVATPVSSGQPDLIPYGLLHDFGERWQLDHHPAIGVWTAVQYPTPTSQRIIVAHSADELAGKLAAAETQTGSQPG